MAKANLKKIMDKIQTSQAKNGFIQEKKTEELLLKNSDTKGKKKKKAELFKGMIFNV